MAVYALSDDLVFPHPSLAEPGGLLAVGGDLSPDRLLLAYSSGIFPWYSNDGPILWWCPAPRPVLIPAELHVGRTLRRARRRCELEFTMDREFGAVVAACAQVERPDQDGTWITAAMQRAYMQLHDLGLAHSVEAWNDGELVGGLYGVSLGTAFFGESMFSRQPEASKLAFIAFVEQLEQWDFGLIDCQVVTSHLQRFGTREIELEDFLERLEKAIEQPTRKGRWSFDDGD